MIVDHKKKIKILYIAGSGRNGSTLVSNILGQFAGYITVGEVISIWKANHQVEMICGCGKNFLKCDFWGQITKVAFDKMPDLDYKSVLLLSKSETRYRNFPKIFWSYYTGLYSKRLKSLIVALGTLYSAIAKYNSNAIIVDASKSPVYAAILNLIPSIETYVVHLVRDPRAVAYSRSIPKGNLKVLPPAYTALVWLAWNASINFLNLFGVTHYRLLRYEDFVENPRATIDSLVKYVNRVNAKSPFLDSHRVLLRATHSVAGNPARFQLGEIEVVADDRWIGKMRRLDRIFVTLLTLPLLRKYGYPIFWRTPAHL